MMDLRAMTDPKAGDVFAYGFLWKREHESGLREGRKKRPVCIAITTTTAGAEKVVYIVPITTLEPSDDRIALEVPQIEAKRGGLDADNACWVILDEYNADVFERSYTFEDRIPLGAFSPKYTERLQRRLLDALSTRRAKSVNRLKD